MGSVTAPPPLVRIRNLSKAFSGVQALANVHFDLDAGEVHALMGENGAGKSTLMKVLSGVYPRDSGEILLDGQAVEIASPRAAQALGIQIIHQELNLMNHLTAAQNIFIGREPRRRAGLLLDENRLNAQAAAIFARLHLALDPRTPMSELTVARQQMVEIAKALSFDSRVLIMDEPTAALNNAEIAELFRIIRQLKGHAWASSTGSLAQGFTGLSGRQPQVPAAPARLPILLRNRKLEHTRRHACLPKQSKVVALVVGGPIFAFALLWLGCSSVAPVFAEYCGPHLMFGLLAGLTLAFWFVVPMSLAVIRVLRGNE